MNISALVLVLANLIPLAGVLFWNWDTVLVLALYWIENLVIGAFTLIKILSTVVTKKQSKGLFLAGFFSIHYGAFCAAHGQLLAKVLDQTIGSASVLGKDPDGILELFWNAYAVLLHFWQSLAPAIWLGVAALVLSKLISFIEHFLLRGEIFQANPDKLMMQPYKQIVVMHVGLILGALLLQKMGSPTWLLAIVVAGKIVIDYRQFSNRHSVDPRLMTTN